MPKDRNTEAIILLCSLQNFENNTTGQTFKNRKKKPKRKQKQKSDILRLCLDYVTHASFIVLKRVNVKIFH
jgi:hypothetical protein